MARQAFGRRWLNDPLLVTLDGAPGIIKAIEVCFPRATRTHRVRNLVAKLPEDVLERLFVEERVDCRPIGAVSSRSTKVVF